MSTLKKTKLNNLSTLDSKLLFNYAEAKIKKKAFTDLEKSIKEKDYEIEKREDQVEHLEFMTKSKETTMSLLEAKVSDKDAQITLLEFDIRDKSDRIEEYEEKI